MEPRIYTYKITFEEIPHWYWGVHKEQEFGEEYWGSPTTNAWVWEFYTPCIQILELFPYTDDGWREANKVEDRLIKPDVNNPLCLNENYGGFFSLAALSKGGKTRNQLPVKESTRAKLKERVLERLEDESYRKKTIEILLANQEKATLAAMTPEARKKRRESLKENGHQQGEKNSQYGTRLTHHKGLRQTRRIPKEAPLEEGWEEGAIYDFEAYFERLRKREEEKKQAELRKKRKWEEKRSLYAPWWEVYKNHTFREFCSITGYSKSHQNLLDKFTRYGLRDT
jgi:hypothetical protein